MNTHLLITSTYQHNASCHKLHDNLWIIDKNYVSTISLRNKWKDDALLTNQPWIKLVIELVIKYINLYFLNIYAYTYSIR